MTTETKIVFDAPKDIPEDLAAIASVFELIIRVNGAEKVGSALLALLNSSLAHDLFPNLMARSGYFYNEAKEAMETFVNYNVELPSAEDETDTNL